MFCLRRMCVCSLAAVFVQGGIKQNPHWENHPMYQKMRDTNVDDVTDIPDFVAYSVEGIVSPEEYFAAFENAVSDAGISPNVFRGGRGLVMAFGAHPEEMEMLAKGLDLGAVHGTDWYL